MYFSILLTYTISVYFAYLLLLDLHYSFNTRRPTRKDVVFMGVGAILPGLNSLLTVVYLFRFIHKSAWWNGSADRSFIVKCPSCENDVTEDESFVTDTYVKLYPEEKNLVHYKCKNCSEDSFWDFDHRRPVLYNKSNKYVKHYMRHFK